MTDQDILNMANLMDAGQLQREYLSIHSFPRSANIDAPVNPILISHTTDISTVQPQTEVSCTTIPSQAQITSLLRTQELTTTCLQGIMDRLESGKTNNDRVEALFQAQSALLQHTVETLYCQTQSNEHRIRGLEEQMQTFFNSPHRSISPRPRPLPLSTHRNHQQSQPPLLYPQITPPPSAHNYRQYLSYHQLHYHT